VLRIAFNAWFLNKEETGTGQYSTRVLDAFRRLEAGAQSLASLLHVISPSHKPSPIGRLGRNLSKGWFEQALFPLECRKAGADIAFVPYFAPPLFSPAPVVVTIHDLIPLIFPEYAYSPLVKLYNRLVSAAARKAALIVADSHSTRNDVIRILNVPPSRIQVIYPGVDESLGPVEDEGTLQATRKRYNLPEEFLLYLGGFDHRKNIGVLLEAYAILWKRLGGRAPKLVLAGKLPARETPALLNPRRLVEECDLGDRVHFTGWVAEEDKPALYSLALAFLYPSLYEGFGLPPLEAMACGCPVLASEASSLPEVIGDGALLIDPHQPEAWADKMEMVILNRDLAAELRERGIRRVKAFSWLKTARELWKAFNRLLTAPELSP